jgi:SAM-dependent methyltransferase
MIAYGSELAGRSSNPVIRAAIRLLGSYDLGARIRFAAINSAMHGLPAPERVLDVGCGLGLLCFAMHRLWPNATFVGSDIDRARLREARDMAREQGLERSVSFEHVDDYDPNDGHDVVTCVDVLEHVSDDTAFVATLFAATRPGGRLLLHVPALVKRRYLAEFPEQADHVRPGYDAPTLVALLRNAGFDEVHARPTFGSLGTLGWEGFALARRGNIVARILLPLWYVCALLDTVKIPERGNGLLAVARRNA